MTHFADSVWADFARGVASQETASAVERHLAEGCAECSQTRVTWQNLVVAARNEKSYAAPEDLVRLAKQEFRLQQQEKPSVPSLWAQLQFDSFSQPATAGVRSAAAVARQMVYEANGITIDLRLECLTPSNRMLAVGQVLDKTGPLGVPIPILVFNELGDAVVQTQTTEFGEFQFEFDASQPLRLSVEADSHRIVQVPLRDLQIPLQK